MEQGSGDKEDGGGSAFLHLAPRPGARFASGRMRRRGATQPARTASRSVIQHGIAPRGKPVIVTKLKVKKVPTRPPALPSPSARGRAAAMAHTRGAAREASAVATRSRNDTGAASVQQERQLLLAML